MTETREQAPTEQHKVDWVLYRTPARFAELAALNAGVVLEPLASGQPVEDMDPRVVAGMAALSKDMVTAIVVDHSEMPETAWLLKRHRAIRSAGKFNGLHSIPLGVPEHLAKRNTPPRTLFEIANEVLFDAEGNPTPERVGEAVEHKPQTPDVVDAVDMAFSNRDIDLSDKQNLSLTTDIFNALIADYSKRYFDVDHPSSKETLEELVGTWIKSLGSSSSPFYAVVRQEVIKRVFFATDPSNSKIEESLSIFNRAMASLIELETRVTDPDLLSELQDPVLEAIDKRLELYTPYQRSSVLMDIPNSKFIARLPGTVTKMRFFSV